MISITSSQLHQVNDDVRQYPIQFHFLRFPKSLYVHFSHAIRDADHQFVK